VWNGLDPEEFIFDPKRERQSFAFLSKTSWKVKNLKGAARLCSRAGVPLSIAGGDRPWGVRAQAWFKSGWSWEGKVSGPKKAEFLASAKALVFPVLWPEPFGLVVAEALFSGTPVLATPMGSLAELVSPEVGSLIPIEEEARWVALLRDLDQQRVGYDPEVCRAHALKHFHYRAMTSSYLELYRQCMLDDGHSRS
jgi:glycosyltransferase involved in cell wall biosynthesis